jgi:hypothetical protein
VARVPIAPAVPAPPRSALSRVSLHPSGLGLSSRASGTTPGDAAPGPGYAILFMDGADEADERRGRSGLSHADAMSDAEELQRKGKTARVMHVLGSRSYEVDRYPPR